MVATAIIGRTTHAAELSPTSDELEFFEKEVRPVLAEHCYSCHSVDAKKVQAGLLVDSRASLIRGGDSGEALVPGDADASLLIEAVRYDSYEMPPKGKLPDQDIEALERWVEMGAPWPVEDAPSGEAALPEFDLLQRKSDHWAWQPIKSSAVPSVENESWPRDDLDHFVLAKLEQANLQPAGDVDRAAILRRLYFDLIGLPPTPEQTAAFLNDTAPGSTKRLVDELLDSPHFGERWGRHWLDLVRYAESRGHEFDNDAPNAYQYRDYVIRGLNADVPYDQWVREHIAGDLLAHPRLNPDKGFNESILGTGFWFLGEWVHSPVDIRKDESDRFDNMIDVMSKTFLGVTVACARCHDHKFDAISTADYYSLSGFLQSSDYCQVRFESLEHNQEIADELATLDQSYQNEITALLAKSGVEEPSVPSLADEAASYVVVDFGSITANDYLQQGFAFGKRARLAGEPYLAMDVESPALRFSQHSAAVSDWFWDGLESLSQESIAERNRLQTLPSSGRTLRTPTFELTHGDVYCRVRGKGHVVACVDSHRLVAGPLHGETVKPIKEGEPWVHMKLKRYVGHRLHLEFVPDQDSQLQVSLVTQGTNSAIRAQIAKREDAVAEIIRGYEEAARKALGDQEAMLVQSWADARAKLGTRVKRRSHLAMAMIDGTGEDDRILIRGNSSKPGDVEPRHFLTAINGNQPMAIPTGSGRLELAEQINDPNNPLTSRVIVNRIWHHLMGRGIVPTTDDFGVLGQRPTHPELLDHLAIRFVDDGRSIKRMIRTIALSRSYQMSSQADPIAVEADPNNLLWHHRPPKRLEGEVIRDALLALSGRLARQPFGPSVPIHLTDFMDGRGKPNVSGPMDGDGRRSIYVAVRRNFLSPFMLAFDTPSPFSTMGRRNVSNVPAQSLILMNDPFVVKQAKGWADRAIEQRDNELERIQWMYESALARKPTDRELQFARAFLGSGNSESEQAAWQDFAHAIINTKEFIFLR
ncbi:Planctomycete cytochrome C [Rubripirellula amarantea]|uniref:Planctomycete cytochrome C n=2 Tax=Rubripirellula amarantea TaxID=2527999 RepID=A0A5C5WXU6_9BACT|nr:Planctomycete cytochrome C [Rubripirellula amarantea]